MHLLNGQCRFEQCIFILAHMRCGSTALSNIFCSRPDVSGYGEAHIDYALPDALGRLVVNQALRRSWSFRATHLFDKVLHNRHDENASSDFFNARAVFLARPPGRTIRSICALYRSLGRREYETQEQAADYYLARLEALQGLWHRFPADRRIGLTYSELLSVPETALDRITQRFSIKPCLENSYESPSASQSGGGGDPTMSARHSKIKAQVAPQPDIDLEISDQMRSQCEAAYGRLIGAFTENT